MRVIGILDSASPESRGEELTAFYGGLRNMGVDSLTIIVSYVWANNVYQRLPFLAGMLVRHNAEVIVAAGGPVSAIAAQSATRTIPIVFTTVADPVRSQLVLDLDRPGKNATGTWGFTSELERDRMRILAQLVGKRGVIGVLANPDRPHPRHADFDSQRQELESTALTLRLEADVMRAGTVAQIDEEFARLSARVKKKEVVALVVTADPFFNSRRKEIIEKVDALGIPAIYQWRSFVEAGGLMSFGPSKVEAYRNAGELVGQILDHGKRPEELPVRRADNFELVISRSKARTLRIPVPTDPLDDIPVTALP
jgi:putative ABC transport system substrate-binding protein